MSTSVSKVDGSCLWAEQIRNNMTTTHMLGREYEIFTGLPVGIYHALKRNAERFPDRVCIIDDFGIKYTFSQVLEMTDSFSESLYDSQNVRQGAHVALLMYNSIEFCVAFLALNRLGAVVIPFPTKYKREEIFSLIQKSDLDGMICDKDFCGWFKQDFEKLPFFLIKADSHCNEYSLPNPKTKRAVSFGGQPKPEDTAVLMFTSGTTSFSKGVMLSNFNIMHAVSVYQRILKITEKDSTIIPVPIYHVTGLIALFGVFIFAGASIRLHKYFDAKRILSDTRRFGITFLHGSPTVFSLLLQEKGEFPSLPSLRALACGSSYMPVKKIKELHDWLPDMKFHTVYGLTETSSPAAMFPGDAYSSPYIGASGIPVPGTSFKICDEMGRCVPIGQIGTVYIKGTVVLTGYYKMETASLKDGWLDTGDLGYFNEESYLFIVDRKKDMINRGGEKVCSYDVENELYSMEGILEAAVVGIPDELYGEVPAAMVVLEDAAVLTCDDIKEYLGGKLAKFKIPVKIIIADALPLTPNSKIDKKKIRKVLSDNLML